MVKAKKKKKRVKEKPSQNMFVRGGLDLLIMGGFMGIMYQVLYLLITVETKLDTASYKVPVKILEEFGILFLFFSLILICFFFLKGDGFFQKYGGSALISGAVLSVPPVLFLGYDLFSTFREQLISAQVISAKSYIMTNIPQMMETFTRLYFFTGALLLGVSFWGHQRGRKWAAELFMGGVGAGCIALVTSMYGSYESTKFLMQMYSLQKDLIISQFLFPDLLKRSSWLLIILGVLFFSASYIWTKISYRKWTGRTWLFGGVTGAFYGFLRLGMDSRSIRSEITSVRQSIMQLTPYSTSFKDQMLTVETLKEFYVKKMIPLYLEDSLWILVFTGITAIGIYLWLRE